MDRTSPARSPAIPIVIAAVSLLGILALGAVAAVVALAGLGQLTSRVDPAAVPGWFWHFRADPDVRRWSRIGGLVALAVAAGAGAALARAFARPLHGAARWARESELAAAGLRSDHGILLGRRGGRPLVFGGEEHVLLCAPTRTGKGVGVVIPNLLSWPGSVVVLDVKRENWDATAGFRAAHGQEVHLFDPLAEDGRTARFDPLGHIDRTDPVQVLDELQRIAVMLFPHPENADPFWADSARTGFIGVAAYLAETPERAFTMGDIHAELTAGDPRTRFPQLVAARHGEQRPLSAACVRALTDFCASSENTFASVRQTLTSRLNLWLNPRVRAATAASDFDLRDLRRRPMSIYLATSPDNLERVAPLYNLLVQQLVDVSCRTRPDPRRDRHQVLVLLDEFARLGQATVLAKGFAYVAGYGLRLLPVLQSPAQLRGLYGPDLAEEIISNCAVEVVFAPKDVKLARELSERLGDTTVRHASRSRPSGLSSGRRSVSESDHRRPLLLPQELMRLPSDTLIVLKAGIPPVRGRKITYHRERVFTRRLRPAPAVPVVPVAPDAGLPTGAAAAEPPLTLATIAPALAAAGLEPLPPEGATPEEVEAWVERFVDRSEHAELEVRTDGR